MTFAIGEIVEIVGYGQAGAFIGSNVQLPKLDQLDIWLRESWSNGQ